VANALDLGINLRAIVVINPGNPTGNVMRREDIESIIKLAHDNGLLIIADEVYQNNIYTD
jgi:alanine transaminase